MTSRPIAAGLGKITRVSDFAEIYRPTEEHEAFRAAVRELCEEKVAPNAAEADELARVSRRPPTKRWCPRISTAPHIPEAYSGVGADALAIVIVIRGDCSASVRRHP